MPEFIGHHSSALATGSKRKDERCASLSNRSQVASGNHTQRVIREFTSFRASPVASFPPTIMNLPSVYACVIAVTSSSLATLTESRLFGPLDFEKPVFRQSRQLKNAGSPITPDLINSYFAGSGFPKAGRTLDQKIRDAKAFLDVEVPKTGVVGTSVSVVYEDQVVLSEGYGLRNSSDKSTATTKDSIFQLGSVSKTFIAVGIALLVEEGKLDWRDPMEGSFRNVNLAHYSTECSCLRESATGTVRIHERLSDSRSSSSSSVCGVTLAEHLQLETERKDHVALGERGERRRAHGSGSHARVEG